ncbi:hypothetical protein V8F20_012833 [Naviculisporaceae sp. PSN 640]
MGGGGGDTALVHHGTADTLFPTGYPQLFSCGDASLDTSSDLPLGPPLGQPSSFDLGFPNIPPLAESLTVPRNALSVVSDNFLPPAQFDQPIVADQLPVKQWDCIHTGLEATLANVPTLTHSQQEWPDNTIMDEVDGLLHQPPSIEDCTQEAVWSPTGRFREAELESSPASPSPSRSSRGDGVNISQGGSCKECGVRVKNFRSHMRTHGPKRFSCPELGCSGRFHLKTDLKRHQRCVHDKLKLTCVHCGTEITGRRENLLRNMKHKGCGERTA